ncbi:hypothetical protein [Marimonas lutisalis]|uniref:hypothetical protein n=1 Tax=Marimonas lutisalis TaxID=2545756 RepID=UPI0010F4D0B4|nr:hypothetical protein [Marimonas lutisalis]
MGLDYKLNSGTLRPNASVAYLDRDVYVDFSVGFDPQIRGIDFGFGIGGLGGMTTPAPAAGGAIVTTPTTPTTPTIPTTPTTLTTPTTDAS